MALAAVLALAGTTALTVAATHQNAPPPVPPATAAGTLTPTRTAPALPDGPPPTPTTLDIPDIDVHTPLDPLTLDDQGALAPPDRPDHAGWYTTTPAWTNPIVITGHVDYTNIGPAVFYRLGDLRPGQHITLTTTDHHTRTYTINAVRTYPKDAFPTEDVYGPTTTPQLRLITCSNWNPAEHTYTANTIVYATL
ncbi:sortase domain-bontaining protein [Kitasatospora paranensis]|uniref:Sortase domain-bontaining protein n=1 Tax=Kitasatospora paranensis TaxID=258053 RepID=A0ABW2FXQ7_9ACTN